MLACWLRLNWPGNTSSPTSNIYEPVTSFLNTLRYKSLFNPWTAMKIPINYFCGKERAEHVVLSRKIISELSTTIKTNLNPPYYIYLAYNVYVISDKITRLQDIKTEK